MQAANIAEYAILNAAKLDKHLGEQIMALDTVGLALKGATPDDISRGGVICAPDAVRVSSGAISVKFAEPILQG
jgi:selenocysteine-specific translation elongation factor